jgi:hypothetical protein
LDLALRKEGLDPISKQAHARSDIWCDVALETLKEMRSKLQSTAATPEGNDFKDW